jgi:dTDP-L-rhamnose 4-epimerase
MPEGAILVTGAAGFIGSHVVDALVERGHGVRAVDALLPAAHRGRPGYLNPAADWIEGDLREPAVAERAAIGVTAVCHQASMVGLGADIGDIADYVGHNDLATAQLLRALARSGFHGRLVLASSMVVYGEGRYRCARHGVVRPGPRAAHDLDAGRFEPPCPVCGEALQPGVVPEDAPLDPRSVYAATKVAQEHLCSAFSRETGVPVTALRYHNVYGPRMPRDTPYAGVASIFRSALEAGEPPRVFEDGGQRRDFVHVRDVARANLLALTAPQPVRGAFNVASGTPRTVLDMARALAAAFDGSPAPVVTGEWRGGDVRHIVAAAELAAERLGFRAEEDFAAGMREFARAPLRTGIAVRRVRAGEGERVRELRLRALRDAPHAFSSTLAHEAGLTAATWDERARAGGIFVAVEAGEWLGMAGGYLPGDRPGAAELWGTWVAPAARRRGLGRALVDAVVEWARGEGLLRVELSVADVAPEAAALYRGAGFEPTGEQRPLDAERTEILMTRPL